MIERAQAVALAQRALIHLEQGTTDQAHDILRVPVSDYLDAGLWHEEIDRVFKRVPLMAALTAELPRPGDYKAVDMLGVPLLLSRGRDGLVRAFLNVCRHRGAQLCPAGTGTRHRFRCPYHAWVYDDRGALVAVHRPHTFGDVEAGDFGLRPLPAAERHGFVWVRLTGAEPIDLDAWLGEEYGTELARLDLAAWHVYEQRELPGPGWKVAYDGYLENYHVQALHRTTFAPTNTSNLMVVDAFGPHQRILYPSKSLASLRDVPESEWDPAAHCGTVYTFFPNVSIAGTWDGHAVVSQILPGPTPGQSRTIQTVLTREPCESEAERAYLAEFSELLRRGVLEEDYRTGAQVQAALGSGANTHFVFGRNELALQHHHRSLKALLGHDTAKPEEAVRELVDTPRTAD
ncbi:aromatic ring-hydroxylating dioxygenase subunit alpha [Streptomyces dangxiongensis]|uniref:Aromatic ring-hydroxylating dioxygenase subunit alpha n=1 Tax=Streptomyces dangxiongensis TaxID=1442032 RepID=A0A3G2JL93_9ACTN|nr:aromatic ring-hydroxylating dioxygenase subunit alpha [Streptomyces dangxiongensis]AYN40327.1 aromatic ring-hydroxylating dioxygenase subunit alpha [Streptomyces dangxiongensis]